MAASLWGQYPAVEHLKEGFPRFSAMKRVQDGFGVGFGDTEEGAGGAFGAAVALFPVLEGAGTDRGTDPAITMARRLVSLEPINWANR